ncbi:MAG TPA: pantetheine-phosphate adenylyltransferase [Phycisphaerae bacterium]|nr:pantetheine-phosphate adenylyltransferase [Phycisphaerae bacterium]
MKRTAVFPGTFDPATRGHLDIIERGAKLFDTLIVAIGDNPAKKSLFAQAERAEMVAKLVADHPNVRVETYTGLTVTFARQVKADVILRGVRNSVDLVFELEMAYTNRAATGIETVFVMASPEYAFLSSSLIRQIATGGGDVSGMVPELVARRMRDK